MNETMREFILAGNLAGLALGQSPSLVEEKMGPPTDISASRKPLIYRYGALEISFVKGSLYSFTIDLSDPQHSLPERLEIIGWTPQRHTTESQFRDQMEAWGIECRLITTLTFGTQKGIQVGRATVVFDLRAEPLIESIHVM